MLSAPSPGRHPARQEDLPDATGHTNQTAVMPLREKHNLHHSLFEHRGKQLVYVDCNTAYKLRQQNLLFQMYD